MIGKESELRFESVQAFHNQLTAQPVYGIEEILVCKLHSDILYCIQSHYDHLSFNTPMAGTKECGTAHLNISQGVNIASFDQSSSSSGINNSVSSNKAASRFAIDWPMNIPNPIQENTFTILKLLLTGIGGIVSFKLVLTV